MPRTQPLPPIRPCEVDQLQVADSEIDTSQNASHKNHSSVGYLTFIVKKQLQLVGPKRIYWFGPDHTPAQLTLIIFLSNISFNVQA
jgi:hypothetical protein